jgi:hypothetical protein
MSEPTPTKRQRKPAVKKEKKPIHVVAVVTPDGIEGTFTPEPRRPLIVHLPFKSSEVEFQDAGVHYDPKPPNTVQPFDGDGQVYFQVNSELGSSGKEIGVEQEGWLMENTVKIPVKSEHVETPASLQNNQTHQNHQNNQNHQQQPKVENYTRAQLLACYATEAGKTFEVPDTTDVACFWCSHEFDGAPCFLPVKEEMATYHIYGNFCSPQCALSFLLEEHIDSHVRWDRMALLHRMYRPAGKINGRLYPAPPRESLTRFGGVYTIEKFRELIRENRMRVDIHLPPMVSILGTLDTKPIDFYDATMHNTFTGGFSMDRFKSWSEQGGALRLKRSKPLKDRESTLDACFQISVKKTEVVV